MVGARPGSSSLGCLFTLLIVAAVAYFGINVAEVYWRYYRYDDAFAQAARFASQRSDERIRNHLRALADSLDLPDEARRIRIRRTERSITIRAEYTETVELPLVVREIRFRPHAEGSL